MFNDKYGLTEAVLAKIQSAVKVVLILLVCNRLYTNLNLLRT